MGMRIARLTVLALVILGIALWASLGSGSAQMLRLKWIVQLPRFPVDRYGDYEVLAPAVAPDGSIYVTSSYVASDACLLALSPDGTTKWDTESHNQEIGDCLADPSPVVGPDGSIYGRGWENIIALQPDGTRRWTYHGFGLRYITFPPPPAISRDGAWLYMPIGSGRYTFDAQDGSAENKIILRDYLPEDMITSSTATPSVILPDGNVLHVGIGGPQGGDYPIFHAFLVYLYEDGSFAKVTDIQLPRWTDVASPRRPFSPVVSAGGLIYLVTYEWDVASSRAPWFLGSVLYAFDSEGRIRWFLPFQEEVIETEPVLGEDGTLYLGTTRVEYPSWNPQWSTLYAINPQGLVEERWRWVLPQHEYLGGTPAIGADGVIYVPVEEISDPCEWRRSRRERGRIYVLSPEGEVLWSYWTVGGVRSSPALAEDGTLYFTTLGPCAEECEARVYALQTASPGLANSPWPMFRGDPRHTSWVRAP